MIWYSEGLPRVNFVVIQIGRHRTNFVVERMSIEAVTCCDPAVHWHALVLEEYESPFATVLDNQKHKY